MKKMALPLVMLLIICSSQMNAQTAKKIDNTANKVDKTNTTLNSANSTVTTSGETAQNIKSTLTSLFGKRDRKKSDSTSTTTGNAVHFNITNVDYNTLKTLEDNIKTVKGVKSTMKKFNPGGSTIDVVFHGKSDQVWDALSEPVRNLFELQDLDDSNITLDVKTK